MSKRVRVVGASGKYIYLEVAYQASDSKWAITREARLVKQYPDDYSITWLGDGKEIWNEGPEPGLPCRGKRFPTRRTMSKHTLYEVYKIIKDLDVKDVKELGGDVCRDIGAGYPNAGTLAKVAALLNKKSASKES